MKIILVILLSFVAVARGAEPDSMPTSTLDPSALDRSTPACRDFYQFACGGWLKKTEIPPDRSAWGRSFYEIIQRNEKVEREILEAAAAGKKEGQGNPDWQKLGDYYATCLDEDKAETASMETLGNELAKIGAIESPQQLATYLAELHLQGPDALFGFGADHDFRDSSRMIAAVDQGGLSLPDREYYLSDKGKMPEIRKLFREHLEKVLELLGDSPARAKAEAETVMAIETKLAKVSLAQEVRRDPKEVFHPYGKKWLLEKAPAFAWDDYFHALGDPKLGELNVAVPGFFLGLNELLKETKLPALKDYLRWHLIGASLPALGKAFVDESFRFHSKALSGEKELKARWKRCVVSTGGAMAQPLGRSFVARTFGEKGKDEAKEMVKQIERSQREMLAKVPWMDEPTRKEALAKLEKVFNQIGFPDKWRDYSGLKIERKSYLANLLAANEFNSRYELAKIGKASDREEWGMPPQEVNAYYSPEDNKMVFPAGILQVPFFSTSAPLPMNYGGIGLVMGHELTHGFDDEGRRFDEKGNLRDWWTPQVEKEFSSRAACLAKQYGGYTVLEDLHLNGKLTLGENIADQGGLHLSYDSFQRVGKGDPKVKEVQGFTPAQQFFLGFAQSWCTKLRPERARMLVTIDPHSPAKYRVNGPLTNFRPFAEAFGCKAGDPMVNPQPCTIW